MDYKVIYHQGEDFGLSTVVKVGVLTEEKKELFIVDKKDSSKKIEIKTIKDVHLTPIKGVGQVLKVEFKDSSFLYLAAYKGVCLANFFVRIDDELTEEIEKSLVVKK